LVFSKPFRTVTRLVAECERARGQALGQLRNAIRTRIDRTGMSPNARHRPGISVFVHTQKPAKRTQEQKSGNEPKRGSTYNEDSRR
jgi:hypothetical protein